MPWPNKRKLLRWTLLSEWARVKETFALRSLALAQYALGLNKDSDRTLAELIKKHAADSGYQFAEVMLNARRPVSEEHALRCEVRRVLAKNAIA